MTLLSNVNQAFSIIVNDEGKKAVIYFSTGLVGVARSISYDPTTFYSKTGTQGYQKFKEDYFI